MILITYLNVHNGVNNHVSFSLLHVIFSGNAKLIRKETSNGYWLAELLITIFQDRQRTKRSLWKYLCLLYFVFIFFNIHFKIITVFQLFKTLTFYDLLGFNSGHCSKLILSSSHGCPPYAKISRLNSPLPLPSKYVSFIFVMVIIWISGNCLNHTTFLKYNIKAIITK